MSRPDPVPARELLEHLPWVRRLARRLVGESASEDLVQDVCLAAMRTPPRESRAWGSWLRTVVRRLASNRRREDGNRRRREAWASTREAEVDDADLLEKLELHTLLVELVRELPPTLRSVILLRFYYERSTEEIADELGITRDNVRTRVHRGIERLRARLDERMGDRKTWHLAFVGWLSGPTIAPTPTTAPIAGPVAPVNTLTKLLGGIAMKKVVGGLVGLVILFAISFWSWDAFGPSGPEPGDGSVVQSEVSTANDALPIEDEPTTESSEPTDVLATIRVIDRVDRSVIGRARVVLVETSGRDRRTLHESMADETGEAALPESEIQRVDVLFVDAPGYVPSEMRLDGGEALPEEIGLMAGFELRGRVLLPSGEPAAGGWVEVVPELTPGDPSGEQYDLPTNVKTGWSTPIDRGGRFAVASVGGIVGLMALVPGHPPAKEVVLNASSREDEIVITLTQGRTLAGRVRDAEGQPVVGALVKTSSDAPHPPFAGGGFFQARTDESGHFVWQGLPLAVRQLHVTHPDHPRFDEYHFRSQADAAPLEIVLPRRYAIRGRLLCEHRPVVDADVQIAGRRPGVRTDQDGRFVAHFEELPDQRGRIGVLGVGHARVELVRESRDQDLGDIVLSAGRTLRVVVTEGDEPCVGAEVQIMSPARVPEGAAFMSMPYGTELGSGRSDLDGACTIAGLDDHDEVYVSVQKDGRAPTSRRIELYEDVTGIEIALERSPHIVGRITDAAGAHVPGAALRLRPVSTLDPFGPRPFDHDTLADCHGRFRIESVRVGEPLVLEAGAPGFVTTKVALESFDPAEARELNVILDAGARIVGRVTDEAGVGIASARVRAGKQDAWSDRLEFSASTITDEQGRYELTGLPPAKPASLSVVAPGFVRAASHLNPRTTEPLVHDVTLVRALVWTGRVVDTGGAPVASAEISVRSPDGSVSAQAGMNGEFRVDGIDPSAPVTVVVRSGWFFFQKWQFAALDLPTELVLECGSLAVSVEVAGEPFPPNSARLQFEREGVRANQPLTLLAGKTRIERFPVGEWQLRVTVEGYPPSPPCIVEVRPSGTATAALEVSSEEPIVVRVVGPDGAPVVGADLKWWDGRWRGHERQKTDASGEVRTFREWDLRDTLEIRAAGYATHSTSWIDPGHRKPVVIPLEPEARAVISVVDEAGDPVLELRVSLRSWSRSPGPWISPLDSPTHVFGGQIEMTELRAGRYVVDLFGRSSVPDDRIVIDLDPGEHLEFTHVYRPGVVLTGTVRVDGRSVSGGKVDFTGEWGTATDERLAADGGYELAVPSPGRCTVRYTSDGAQTWVESIDVESDGKLDLDFRSTVWRGRIVDRSGDLQPNIEVWNLETREVTTTDAQGRFELTRVNVGPVRVGLVAPESLMVVQYTTASEHEAELVLPEFGPPVRFVRSGGSRPCELVTIDGRGRPSEPTTFRGSIDVRCPLDVTEVWATAPGRGWQRIELDPRAPRPTVELELPETGVLGIGAPKDGTPAIVRIEPLDGQTIPPHLASIRIARGEVSTPRLPVGRYAVHFQGRDGTIRQQAMVVSGPVSFVSYD